MTGSPSTSSQFTGIANGIQGLDDQIKVVVRLRPSTDAAADCVVIKHKDKNSTVPDAVQLKADEHNPVNDPSQLYPFFFSASPHVSQSRLFKACGRQLVDKLVDGFNGALLAFGQTGSGKTYTMLGPSADDTMGKMGIDVAGIVPRSLLHLFQRLHASGGVPASSTQNAPMAIRTMDPSTATSSQSTWLVKLSALEIYQEVCTDLLAPAPPTVQQASMAVNNVGSMAAAAQAVAISQRLQVREDIVRGVWVDGLSEHVVTTADGAMKLIGKAMSARHVAATRMNRESSRSHCIITLGVEQRGPPVLGDSLSRRNPARSSLLSLGRGVGLQEVRRSKLYLVDLAGSEAVKRSGAEGERFKEAATINKSLSYLELVIKTLVEAKPGAHVPYRNSKLTHILQCALGGNALTTIVACVNPSVSFRAETKRTLDFAARATKVQNRAVRNLEHEGNAQALAAEVARLQKENAALRTVTTKPSTRLSANRPPVEGSSRSSTNLVQVVAQLSDMTATNTQLNEQNAALREELAGMQREKEDLQYQVEHYRTQTALLEGVAQEAEHKIAKAEACAAEAATKVADAEARIASLAKAVAAAEDRAQAAEARAVETAAEAGRISAMKSSVAAAEARAEAAKAQAAEAVAGAAAAMAQFKAPVLDTTAIEAAQKQLEHWRQQAERWAARATTAEEKLQQHSSAMNKVKGDIAAYKKACKELVALNSSLMHSNNHGVLSTESLRDSLKKSNGASTGAAVAAAAAAGTGATFGSGHSSQGGADDTLTHDTDGNRALGASHARAVAAMVAALKEDEEEADQGDHTNSDSFYTSSTSTSGFTHMPGESLASLTTGRALPLPGSISIGDTEETDEANSHKEPHSVIESALSQLESAAHLQHTDAAAAAGHLDGTGTGHTSTSTSHEGAHMGVLLATAAAASGGVQPVGAHGPCSSAGDSTADGGHGGDLDWSHCLESQDGAPDTMHRMCSCEEAVLGILAQPGQPCTSEHTAGSLGMRMNSQSGSAAVSATPARLGRGRYVDHDDAHTVSSPLSGEMKQRGAAAESLSEGASSISLSAAPTDASRARTALLADTAAGNGSAFGVFATPVQQPREHDGIHDAGGSACVRSGGGSNMPGATHVSRVGAVADSTPGQESASKPQHPLMALQQRSPTPVTPGSCTLGGPQGFSFLAADVSVDSAFSLTASMLIGQANAALQRSASMSRAAAAAIANGATPGRSPATPLGRWGSMSINRRSSTHSALQPGMGTPPLPYASSAAATGTPPLGMGLMSYRRATMDSPGSHSMHPAPAAAATAATARGASEGLQGSGATPSPLRLSLQSVPLIKAGSLTRGASLGGGSPMPTARLWAGDLGGHSPMPLPTPSASVLGTPASGITGSEAGVAGPGGSVGGATSGMSGAATSMAGPSVLRAKVARLQQDMAAQRDSAAMSEDMLAMELNKRLEVEALLRAQLSAATQEAGALGVQVEQLLGANDALGAENAARSEHIAALEGALSRLYYQLRSLANPVPTSNANGLRSSTNSLSSALVAAAGAGSSLRNSVLLNSLDLASPGSPMNQGGQEAKVSKLLEVVAGQMRNMNDYTSQLESALQGAQSKIIRLEVVAERMGAMGLLASPANSGEDGRSIWPLQGGEGESWLLQQLDARDTAIHALKEQLVVAESQRQEAEVQWQLHERAAADLQLQVTQWSVAMQRLQTEAATRTGHDAQLIRDLELQGLDMQERLMQMEEAMNAERMQLASANAARAFAEEEARQARVALNNVAAKMQEAAARAGDRQRGAQQGGGGQQVRAQHRVSFEDDGDTDELCHGLNGIHGGGMHGLGGMTSSSDYSEGSHGSGAMIANAGCDTHNPYGRRTNPYSHSVHQTPSRRTTYTPMKPLPLNQDYGQPKKRGTWEKRWLKAQTSQPHPLHARRSSGDQGVRASLGAASSVAHSVKYLVREGKRVPVKVVVGRYSTASGIVRGRVSNGASSMGVDSRGWGVGMSHGSLMGRMPTGHSTHFHTPRKA